MITTFNRIPLPEAHDRQSTARLLEGFASTALPGFVIRQAGANLDQALEGMLSLLPATIQLKDEKFIVADNDPDQDTDNHRDFGLHIDTIEITEPEITPITFHHTHRGIVDASLFLPGVEVLDMARRKNGDQLPFELTALFKQGKIDTDYAQATCHHARLYPGDMLVFKDGKPVVHDFTTIQAPRTSSINLGTLELPNLALGSALLTSYGRKL